jgi:N-acetylmuramoyl-L-alanine amidase
MAGVNKTGLSSVNTTVIGRMFSILASRWAAVSRLGMPCVGLILFLGSFTFIVAPDENFAPFPRAMPADAMREAAAANGPPMVVIDPGHGGIDDGTKYFGLAEKTLTLDVAGRLDALLRAARVQTVLTRREDVYVSLPRRAEIANQAWETDHNIIFVSIHFNQSAVGYVDGIETYYADQKIPLATDWTWVGFFQNSDDDSLDRGTALAADIQGALTTRMQAINRGIKSRSLYVTRHTRMPAVLVECGFLSNKIENQLLRDDSYRDRIAQGIETGIMAYVQTMHGASPPHLASASAR